MTKGKSGGDKGKMEDKLLTIQKAAKLLRVSITTLRRYDKNGVLTPRRSLVTSFLEMTMNRLEMTMKMRCRNEFSMTRRRLLRRPSTSSVLLAMTRKN
ncbi:MAG: hypothetical protein A3F31_00015 [Candidatus Levybacteria bacterium RIFCSPHIGHO2_12_FULL_38_12]|nr:MAG: hypothetical protein A3F31_00015 [Candidatus Levybacteria bacterium RIFCSPHIGHO2_12_FULL_38_12]OGH34601.1 MAG: hypothetical protein A3A47_01570 [Candidatus Levybacteria bacterium RIFCSPLOWO2_01_FULL_37_20]OGH43424.1 MAG: hypothetical protein A3J14_04470 [Candidatus Levybacteria bacterium RIFCSPLOWO2_02_FULL_37_18]